MNEYESIDDMLDYISDNADTILKSFAYDSNDPEGIKHQNDLEALQELLDELVADGLLEIVGKNSAGEKLYRAVE